MVNKFENLFLPLVFFTVQFSKSCPTPFSRFRSLKSACLVYQPSPFPSSVFCAFSLIIFLTFPLGSNVPPLGSALPSADFANYTHLSPFVNDFLPFYFAFLFFLFPSVGKRRSPFPLPQSTHCIYIIFAFFRRLSAAPVCFSLQPLLRAPFCRLSAFNPLRVPVCFGTRRNVPAHTFRIYKAAGSARRFILRTLILCKPYFK